MKKNNLVIVHLSFRIEKKRKILNKIKIIIIKFMICEYMNKNKKDL